MADNDIRGAVTDSSGNPVEGAVVEVTRAETDGQPTPADVVRTTTDSNGEYIIDSHPESDGTSLEWHVAAYYYDGSNWQPAVNRPGVTASIGAPPDSGLLRWEFEAGTGTSVSDSFGSFSGTTNATWTTTNQQGTYALDHDGVDDQTVSDSTLPTSVTGGSARSVGGWIYPQTIDTSVRHIFDYGNQATGESFGFFIDGDGNGSLIFFQFGSENDFDTGIDLSANTWYHIVATYDGSVVSTYVDGSDTPTTDQSISLDTASSEFYVGSRADNTGYADEIADDIRIYDKALSDTEVNNWFNTGSING